MDLVCGVIESEPQISAKSIGTRQVAAGGD